MEVPKTNIRYIKDERGAVYLHADDLARTIRIAADDAKSKKVREAALIVARFMEGLRNQAEEDDE